MNKSKAWRIANEINAMNNSQLYELARELVMRHSESADKLDMMIRTEFQEQLMAYNERQARKAKVAEGIARDLIGV